MNSTKKTPAPRKSPKAKKTSAEQEVINQLEELNIPKISKISQNKSLLLTCWRLLSGILKMFK